MSPLPLSLQLPPSHMGLIPGSGRSPGEGNGNLLQYSCPGNPTDRGAWGATVHGVAKGQTYHSFLLGQGFVRNDLDC